MLRVGLTGGIGSGKSTVAKIFETLGAPVYYADETAKRLLHEDQRLIQQIKDHFGEESYIKGQYNRAYIAGIVFHDPEKLQLLNSIVHPATLADAEQWMKGQTFPYAIKEAALIFESDAYKQLDEVIGVYAPAALRISRTIARDGSSEEEVLARISKQMNEEEKMKRCDHVIINDESQLVIPQVIALHQQFIS